MSIIEFLKLYIIIIPIGLAIDIFWIGFLAKNLYLKELGKVIRKSPNGGLDANIIPAALFYLIFLAGLIFFTINNKTVNGSLSSALIAGAFFGLTCYATYDLTNLATLKDFPIKVVIIDLVWGTFLSTLLTLILFYINKAF